MRAGSLDVKGRTFGKLTALKIAEAPEGKLDNRRYWLCECECGNTEVILGSDLTGNRRRQCRACTAGTKDIEGLVFGCWKVISRAKESEIPDSKTAHRNSWWRIECVHCGQQVVRSRTNLRNQPKCDCMKAHRSPRPFVKVQGINHKLNLKTKTKQCAWCGKIFELECVGEWGWNIGHDLFCTYKCMRNEEAARKGKKKIGERLA